MLDYLFIFQWIDDGRHFEDLYFPSKGGYSHEEAVQRKDDFGRELQITLFRVQLVWVHYGRASIQLVQLNQLVFIVLESNYFDNWACSG